MYRAVHRVYWADFAAYHRLAYGAYDAYQRHEGRTPPPPLCKLPLSKLQ